MAAAVGSNAPPRLRDFVFTEKLGSGTYATVYKAYRKGGQREVVAIKCVEKATLNKVTTENLLTEIELLKRLRHENIVQLKDFQWDQHYIYLIMEYCSGGDLSRFIQAHRTLSELAVKRFLQQLALALKYMRSQNVAHMDLKPQNILLSSPTNPVIKVGDFGFAHYLIGDTEAEILRGSPLYMAPEIVIHRQYNEKADLWSTGVILYECLFGRAPFASRSLRELEMKIKDQKSIELPYGVRVSDNVRDLLHGLLQRDPEGRMSYENFFAHSFVDLQHVPSPLSLDKAIEISAKAVALDTAGDHQAAITLYCQSLEYYVPAIHYEKDPRRKEAIRKRVRQYMDRAEELKDQFKPNQEDAPDTTETTDQTQAKPLDTLIEMSSEDPHLLAALKLIKVAECKEHREDYDTALEKYELALGALIQLLKSEPKGKRRELLTTQVPQWMGRAEKIKAFLEVRKVNIEQIKALEEQQEEESQRMLSENKVVTREVFSLTERGKPVLIQMEAMCMHRALFNSGNYPVVRRVPSPRSSAFKYKVVSKLRTHSGVSTPDQAGGVKQTIHISPSASSEDLPSDETGHEGEEDLNSSSGSDSHDLGVDLIHLRSDLPGSKLDPKARWNSRGAKVHAWARQRGAETVPPEVWASPSLNPRSPFSPSNLASARERSRGQTSYNIPEITSCYSEEDSDSEPRSDPP